MLQGKTKCLLHLYFLHIISKFGTLPAYTDTPWLDPWTTLDCVGTFHEKSVKWQRPGRTWTSEEREELVSSIMSTWTKTFRGDQVMGTPQRVTIEAEVKPPGS